MARPKLIEGPEAASMIKCSVKISPGVSREKQNNICVSIYSVKLLTIWHRDVRS